MPITPIDFGKQVPRQVKDMLFDNWKLVDSGSRWRNVKLIFIRIHFKKNHASQCTIETVRSVLIAMIEQKDVTRSVYKSSDHYSHERFIDPFVFF